jgi:GTPase
MEELNTGVVGLFEPENDEGNIEYKQHLIEPPPERLERLISQMKYRMTEGGGEALYELGVSDHGIPHGLNDEELYKSMETMKTLAEANNAEANIVYIKAGKMKEHSIVEVLVRSNPMKNKAVELSICVLGNVDAGKSTITSTLTRGKLDNGNGLARTACFRFKHEIDSGRTSSNSVDNFISFDQTGAVLNYNEKGILNKREDVFSQASRRVSFYDGPGHEDYLKTALINITGGKPAYNMLVVGANAGFQKMTKEHMGITVALGIPFFIVVTKIDMAPENIRNETLDTIKFNLNKIGKDDLQKTKPYIVKEEEDVLICSKHMGRGTNVVPIFQVSNVTGEGLDKLKMFLNLIPSDKEWIKQRDNPVEFQIDSVFKVPGTGIVVAGIMTSGIVTIGSGDGPILLLGPFSDGSFKKVRVKGIHMKCVKVNSVQAGTMASFAIRLIEGRDRTLRKNMIRRGMVLVDPNSNPKAARMFAAVIQILHHPGTIKVNYEPVATLGTTYQAVKIHSMNTDILRSGDTARVRFRFVHRPEYISPGMYIVFRENTCKGFGIIKRVIYDESRVPPFKRIKINRKQAYKRQTPLKREANRKAQINNRHRQTHSNNKKPINKFSVNSKISLDTFQVGK